MKFLTALLLGVGSLFSVADLYAQGADNDELKDQIFWVKPAKQSFRRLEFFRQANLDSVTFPITSKKQIRVVGVTRGWMKVNFLTAYSVFDDGYLPIGYFQRYLYVARSDYQFALDRGVFFKEDPDAIQARIDAVNAPRAAPVVPQKNIASKFFRHKKKCCGLGDPFSRTPVALPSKTDQTTTK